jgi:hypothetical protein
VVGQVAEELLDDPHMLTIEQAGVPGFGGGRQHRLQWLAGQRQPGGQLFGVAQAAFGRAAADA